MVLEAFRKEDLICTALDQVATRHQMNLFILLATGRYERYLIETTKWNSKETKPTMKIPTKDQ